MKKIIRHIEFLLMTHDCVIIPGLGAVLSHTSQASYDPERGVWAPPARAFAFNPELSHNDRLLAGSIARRDRISLESASALIADGVAVMRRKLETEGTLSLGMAGTLSLLPDGRMIFSPGDGRALSPALMWLPEVAAQRVARASELDDTFGTAMSRRLRMQRAMRRAGGWAACIAIILSAGWLVSRNMGIDPGAQLASIFPVTVEKTTPMHQPSSTAPTVLILASAPADEVVENIVVKPELKVPASSTAPYCLIVASFSTQADAETFISQNSRFPLEILPKDGKWRVYAAAGATFDEAASAGRTEPLVSQFPSSWVCRR